MDRGQNVEVFFELTKSAHLGPGNGVKHFFFSIGLFVKLISTTKIHQIKKKICPLPSLLQNNNYFKNRHFYHLNNEGSTVSLLGRDTAFKVAFCLPARRICDRQKSESVICTVFWKPLFVSKRKFTKVSLNRGAIYAQNKGFVLCKPKHNLWTLTFF